MPHSFHINSYICPCFFWIDVDSALSQRQMDLNTFLRSYIDFSVCDFFAIRLQTADPVYWVEYPLCYLAITQTCDCLVEDQCPPQGFMFILPCIKLIESTQYASILSYFIFSLLPPANEV